MGHHPPVQPPIQETTNVVANSGVSPLTTFLIILGIIGIGVIIYYWFNKK